MTALPSFRKALYFWPLALTVFLSDCATKAIAERSLTPNSPEPLVGDLLRFTLVYNRSAAMSVDLGIYSRPLLSMISLVALVALWLWYRRTDATSIHQLLGLALVWAGAAGNLWDRLRSDRGVVDFIDFGVAGWRFWVFNVADVAVFLGALALLATSLRQGQRDQAI